MARPGLEPRTSRRPCEHTDHWVTEPHGRSVTISPCLIRFVPESDQNHTGTDETVHLLLAARAQTHTGHQMSQGRKKNMARPRTRTQDLSQTVQAHWPLSYRATWSTCDIWGMILQWGSTMKVCTELPVTTRHHHDMTEKLLKATLNPNKQQQPGRKPQRQVFSWCGCFVFQRQVGMQKQLNFSPAHQRVMCTP